MSFLSSEFLNFIGKLMKRSLFSAFISKIVKKSDIWENRIKNSVPFFGHFKFSSYDITHGRKKDFSGFL